MAVDTTNEVVDYYVGTLISQYLLKPKAKAHIRALVELYLCAQTTVQTISFTEVPVSGLFKLTWNDEETSSINWNADASAVQTALSFLDGLSGVVVTGNFSTGFSVAFNGVLGVAPTMTVSSNTLMGSSSAVEIGVGETDQIIELAIRDAFNIMPEYPTAVGKQLDVIGKITGVSRQTYGFDNETLITLTDDQMLTLIRMAVIVNQADSSYKTICDLLFTYFGTTIVVYDNQDMSMTYVIEQGVGDQALLQAAIREGLLPKPIGVGVGVYFYPPTGNLFSFASADSIPINNGFSSVGDIVGHWLSASDILF